MLAPSPRSGGVSLARCMPKFPCESLARLTRPPSLDRVPARRRGNRCGVSSHPGPDGLRSPDPEAAFFKVVGDEPIDILIETLIDQARRQISQAGE